MNKVLNIYKLAKEVEKYPLTKTQLSQKCGISRVTLDTILKGKEIGLHKFLKLVDVLGKDVGYFFDEEEVTDTNIEDSSSISKPLIVDSQDRLKPTDEQTLSIEYWEEVKKWDEKNSQSSEADQTDMEINIPADYPPEARHQIEKLNLEVNLLRKMIAKQDRFINYLLETKT